MSKSDSFEVYKYLKRPDRSDLFKFPTSFSKDFKDRENIDVEMKYTTLQETRSDYNNKKFRLALLVYSMPAWKIFMVAILITSYILDTWLYTFCKPKERPFIIIMIIISLNLIFTLDVAIVVGLKLNHKWRKTLNLVEPNTTKVLIDVILAFPYSMLYFLEYKIDNCDYHVIAPVAEIIRAYRILMYFYDKSSQAGSNQWTTFLFQYLVLLLLSVHSCTCIWFILSYRGFDINKLRLSWTITATHLPRESIYDWYYLCAYWSIMILTTNALGDIYPVTYLERIPAILFVVLGFLLTTIVFVGSLTSQFITMTSRRAQYVRQLKKIENHLLLIKMDKETTKRIVRYYEDLWYQKSGVFKPKLLDLLPYPLQKEICFDLNAVPLYSSLLFRKLPEPFLRRLSLAMTHQFYLPGDVVYSHDQNKTFMLCISSGVLELLSDEDDESPIISFTNGTCFGEISLIYNMPARCTVKAATYVECQVLEKTAFIKLMVTYPEILNQIRTEIRERITRCYLRKKFKSQESAFSLNIYASKERKRSSIKCLKDRLRYRQGLCETDTLRKEDILDENCIDLYILSEHIKKKTAPFTCLTSKFPWILESNCYLVMYWELYMLLIVAYIALVYPYLIGFRRNFPDGIISYSEFLIAMSLVVNLMMSSVTAIKTKKKYIRTFTEILSYRMSTLGFYLDMLAIIPLEFLIIINEYSYKDYYKDHLFYLCKGTKLCLVWRLSNFFEKIEHTLLINTIAIKVIKYFVYIILLCYWCGVILYLEACFIARCAKDSWFSIAFNNDNDKLNDAVSHRTDCPTIASMYFSTTLVLSVGYGDFIPGDQYDMILVAFISLYGILIFGFFVSEFSAVVTHESRTETAFVEVIMTIDKFMKENSMHPAIKSRIMAFYELQWQYNSGVELTGDNWLEKTVVPAELRKKVLHQARFKALTSTKFFQVKNKAYIHTLSELARDIILPPGEIVYYGGTTTRELYIIESGYCLITSPTLREAKKERVIGPGNHLGLLILLYGIAALDSIVTLTHCKLVNISYSAYSCALSLFPDMKEHDNLLTADEIQAVSEKGVQHGNKIANQYITYSNMANKINFNKYIQQWADNSIINVYKVYKKNKLSYWNSYTEFKFLNKFARFVLMPIIFKPDGTLIKIWSFIRCVTALLLCILVPINIAMEPQGPLTNAIFVLDIICYIDLYIMLHVGTYGSKNQLIYHPYLTAKNYLTGPFLLDFLTCFPWHVLVLIFMSHHDGNDGHLLYYLDNIHVTNCVLKMIKILQIYKLSVAFWAESIGALKRAYLTSVIQFMVLTLLFLNLYTCVLMIITCRYILASDPIDFKKKIAAFKLEGPFIETDFNAGGNMLCKRGLWIDRTLTAKSQCLTPEKVYLLAYYWTTVTFTGAGFGDITAQDHKHMILTICVIIHGAFFFGYVYARIASLKAVADQVATNFQENLKHLELFLTRENVGVSLKKNVIDHWKYQWKRTGGWSHQSILGKLHSNLNEDAVLYMYEKTLREIPLFENVEYSFFRAFAKKLKEVYFQKGYMVIRSNEVISAVYIIYRGKVDIISETNEMLVCMGPGGIFGNIRGATRYLTQSNAVASRNIDLLSIDGADFFTLLKSYPSVYKKVKMCVEKAAKDYLLPTTLSDSDIIQSYPTSYAPEEDDELATNTFESGTDLKNDFHISKSTSMINSYYTDTYFLLFQPHRWFRKSITPDSSLVNFMDRFILLLCYIDFIVTVYQMAFSSYQYFLYFCIGVDTIFLYKIFLDVHTGYMNRYGEYIFEPKKVRKMYFSKVGLRRRDYLANFLICYLAFALPFSETVTAGLFSALRLPQLLRISYLSTYQTYRKIQSSNLFVKLASICVWASILTHVNACLFFKLSCLTPVQCLSSNWISKAGLNMRANYYEKDYFGIYITALWYMVNLLTITGAGDVSSQNKLEVVETIILTIVIKFSTGLLISEMSAMITAHSSSRITYDHEINELRDGLRDMDLSEHQMNKMWEYVRELWNRQQGRQMPELLNELPFRLHCQVMQAVYGSHIKDSIIFSKTEEDFQRMLCMWLRHCVFFPGNYIVQGGDADQSIYFIHRGEVEVLTVHQNLTESIYDVLGPEDSFGIAQGLYVGISHHFSFRARTIVDIVYLKLDDWKFLLDFYPKAAKCVRKKVQNVYLAV